MAYKKINIVFIIFIIFLLSAVSVAQAAPPLQEGSQDASKLGDTIGVDGPDDNVEEEEPSGGNNLGTIMSGKGGTNDTGDSTGDGTDDGSDDGTGDGTDDGADDGTNGDTGDGADDGTDDGTDGDTGDGADDGTDDSTNHPVANAIADFFDVPPEEVASLHEEGNGFGNIVKAYFFADKLDPPMKPQELLEAAHESGWGNVLKEGGIHPGSVGNGGGNRPEKEKTGGPPGGDGPPGQTKKNNNNDSDSGTSIGPANMAGPGGGNGNGNGNGQGNGNGNGGGSQSTGWQVFEVNLGTLPAGSHTGVIGVYNNKKTYNDESTELLVDDVLIVHPLDYSIDYYYTGDASIAMIDTYNDAQGMASLEEAVRGKSRAFLAWPFGTLTGIRGLVPFFLELNGRLVNSDLFRGYSLRVYELEPSISSPEIQPISGCSLA